MVLRNPFRVTGNEAETVSIYGQLAGVKTALIEPLANNGASREVKEVIGAMES